MIIRNAALIFNLLTNYLYRAKAFKTIEFCKWTTSDSEAGCGPILDCYDRKNSSDCNQSFFKIKSSFFMVINEQNNSHNSSLLIGPKSS